MTFVTIRKKIKVIENEKHGKHEHETSKQCVQTNRSRTKVCAHTRTDICRTKVNVERNVERKKDNENRWN